MNARYLLFGFLFLVVSASADWAPFGLVADSEVIIGWTGASSYAQAQGFTFVNYTHGRTITEIQVYVKAVHNIDHVDQLMVEIRDGTTSPGALMAYGVNTSDLANGVWANVTLTPNFNATPNKQYWLIFKSGISTGSNHMSKLFRETGLNPNGMLAQSLNNGTTWGAIQPNINLTCGYTYDVYNYTNYLKINTFNEIGVAPLNTNVSISNSTDTVNFAEDITSYFLLPSNLPTGEIIITPYATGFENRSYTMFLNSATIEELDLMLLNSSASTAYTIYIRNLAGNSIPYVNYSITKTIGGTSYNIVTGKTDVNGVFVTHLHYGDTYSFTLNAAGYASATTDITASTLNPITLILYSTTGVMTWNTSLTSIIPNYWGQPLVQGETSWRTVNASYWLYDYLEFTGACVDYYWNATVLLNQSCGPTNNATNVTVIIGATQTGLVLQKFTITANGSNFTFLSWIPILPSGSGGSPEYRTGMVALIAERLVLADPTGLFAGALAFIVLIGCLLVATYIGGASIMSTIIFLILIAIFTFILPVMPWFYFMIIAVVAFAWIYLKGG